VTSRPPVSGPKRGERESRPKTRQKETRQKSHRRTLATLHSRTGQSDCLWWRDTATRTPRAIRRAGGRHGEADGSSP
jgi:hypothetical protein